MPDNKSGGETPFLTDVKTLRERARQHIQAGAVTSNYGADPKVVCKVLNEALATEIVCVLRYKRHYFMAQGIASDSVKKEFAEHAAALVERARGGRGRQHAAAEVAPRAVAGEAGERAEEAGRGHVVHERPLAPREHAGRRGIGGVGPEGARR